MKPLHRKHLKISGIYCFVNKQNGKRYIGQAKSIYNRYIKHKNDFSNAPIFESALKKWGWSNFEFEILEQCELDKLNEREEYWILYYNTIDRKFGYNLIQRQDTIHAPHSNETKEKIKLSLKKAFPNGRAGIHNSFFGKKHSKETKQSISESKKGKPSPNRKKVIGTKGNEIVEFDSMSQAAEYVGGYRTQIWYAIKHKVPYKEFNWRKISD